MARTTANRSSAGTWGISAIIPRTTASAIDNEIKMLVEDAYHKTERILTEHMDQLQKVAEFLFHNEKMSGEEFRAVMEGTYQPPEEKPQSDSFVSDFDTEKH